jgi:hypothetical protein
MAPEDANRVSGILHRVRSENSGFAQNPLTDGNTRENDLGSDLQLPRDVLVVVHEVRSFRNNS